MRAAYDEPLERTIRRAEVRPHVGQHQISRHALAAVIHKTKVGLRRRVTLIGSQPKPFYGLGVVFWHALAAEKHDTNIDPSYCDAAVRRWQDWTGRRAVPDREDRVFDDIAATRVPVLAA